MKTGIHPEDIVVAFGDPGDDPERRGALFGLGRAVPFIVDAVSSFGGIRCDFTAWQAGLVVTAPQKCLGGTPGLSLLHVSEAAWARMAANPAAPRGSALSILDWRDAHLAGRPFPFTPPITDVYGLHACLEQYLSEGAEAVLQRAPFF